MTDTAADDDPGLEDGADAEKGTPGLLGDALSPVVAPEDTDEERLSEPGSEGDKNDKT